MHVYTNRHTNITTNKYNSNNKNRLKESKGDEMLDYGCILVEVSSEWLSWPVCSQGVLGGRTEEKSVGGKVKRASNPVGGHGELEETLSFLGSTFLFCQENTTMYLRGLTGLHFSMPAFITFGRTTLCPGRRWVCPLPLTPALTSTVGFTPPGISDPQPGIANYHVTCSAMHTNNGDTADVSSILN